MANSLGNYGQFHRIAFPGSMRLLVAAILVPAAGSSGAFQIDFDDGLAAAEEALYNHQYALVDNFYLAPFGVIFSNAAFNISGAFLNLRGGLTSSPISITPIDASQPITVFFDGAVTSVTINGVRDFDPRSGHTLSIQAFGDAGTLVASNTFGPANAYGPSGASTYSVPLTVSAPRIVRLSLDGDFASLGLLYDDLNATPAAPISEPETYAMMLAGLGVLGPIARRRKTQ